MSEAGFLADTHVILWWFGGDRRLTPRHRELLESSAPVFFSGASMAEIAIKAAIGKLKTAGDFTENLHLYRVTELPLTWRHARAVENLPVIHRDPFDRILIAQAQVEGLTLMTSDAAILRYDVVTC